MIKTLENFFIDEKEIEDFKAKIKNFIKILMKLIEKINPSYWKFMGLMTI